MSVFRVHKTDNYTTMSNHHLRNTNLTLKAKGLMSVMLSLPEDWDYSAKGLTTLSLGGEDSVKSALRELEENRYLKRTPIREKGVIKDWQYDIYENPESLENIESEPQGEKPLVAKPLVEKQPQINTKEINTKIINNNFTNVKLEQPSVTHSTSKRHLVNVDTVSTPVKEKKKSRYEQCMEVIDEMIDVRYIELKSILADYLTMRLAIKDKPMYVSGWKALIRKLQELSPKINEQYEIVRQSLENSWATFYPIKNNNYRKGEQNQSVFSEYGQVKAERRDDEVIVNVQF